MIRCRGTSRPRKLNAEMAIATTLPTVTAVKSAPSWSMWERASGCRSFGPGERRCFDHRATLRRNPTQIAGSETVFQQRPPEPRLDAARDENLQRDGRPCPVVLLVKKLHRLVEVERGPLAN